MRMRAYQLQEQQLLPMQQVQPPGTRRWPSPPAPSKLASL